MKETTVKRPFVRSLVKTVEHALNPTSVNARPGTGIFLVANLFARNSVKMVENALVQTSANANRDIPDSGVKFLPANQTVLMVAPVLIVSVGALAVIQDLTAA